jgi:hypothetical protein
VAFETPGVQRRFDLLAITQPVVSDGAGGAVRVGDEGADGAIAELQISTAASRWQPPLGAES